MKQKKIPNYKSMETISCHSNQSAYLTGDQVQTVKDYNYNSNRN